MTIARSRIAGSLAMAAALSFTATPALAGDRWGGGWGGHYHRDRGGVDAGDVIAGLLIVGGIAAIASAASKSSKEKREREERDRDWRDGEYRNDDYRGGNRGYDDPAYDSRPEWNGRGDDRPSGRAGYAGIDGAVDACVSEVEQGDRRVGSVDSVDRAGDGWRVEGRTLAGRDFACEVDAGGRARVIGR